MSSYISALVFFAIVLVVYVLGPDTTHIGTWYFDSVLHVLGGAGLGFFLCALTSSMSSRRWRTFPKILLIVFLFGMIWELFEMHYDIAGYPLWTKLYYVDTVKDLINDAVGGGVVAWLVMGRPKGLSILEKSSQKSIKL